MKLTSNKALSNAFSKEKWNRFPDREDARYSKELIFPKIRPSIQIEKDSQIFTIGSCFARNIEEVLVQYELPTMAFSVPQSEWSGRPNGLLNEYDPGTLAQRLGWAIDGVASSGIMGTCVGHPKNG